jgi:hypothetical protein
MDSKAWVKAETSPSATPTGGMSPLGRITISMPVKPISTAIQRDR